MNSADAWNDDGDDNLEALLGLSVEVVATMNNAQQEVDVVEAAKRRHPSGKIVTPIPTAEGVTLTSADRCDAACSAAALYRTAKFDVGNRPLSKTLDWCRHHFFKHFPGMAESDASGSVWRVVGANPELFEELEGGRNRHQGSDHA